MAVLERSYPYACGNHRFGRQNGILADNGDKVLSHSIFPTQNAMFFDGSVAADDGAVDARHVLNVGEAAEVVNIRVGLKTKFIPFRRPAVGEKVKVDFRVENGDKFGYTVQVVQ